MRVALINPSYNIFNGIKGHGGETIPINLCYLAAYAREKDYSIKFKIFDAEINKWTHQETCEEVKKFSPKIIGITANTCVFDSTIKLIKLIKEKLPDAKLVIGGSHPSALPEDSLKESGADFVVIGEGEVTFYELIKKIKNNDCDFSTVNGIVYKDKNGKFKKTAARELIKDLDTLPYPARDLVDNSLYTPALTKRVRLGPSTILTTSRGCPFCCGFCSARSVWTRSHRSRSTENVLGEIIECINKWGIRTFNLTDELFTANKKRVLDLCNEIIKRHIDISWVCLARAQNLDEETLKAMKDAGCKEISFGIESGNKDILKKIDKKLDMKEAERVIKLTKKIGIKTHASYIIGYLDETVDTIKDTINFAKKLNTDIAAFFIASPLPGTPFYDEAKEKGYLQPGLSWVNFSPLSNQESIFSMPDLNAKTIREWHRIAIKSYYLRPRYIVRKLSSLRHWYEILNLIAGIKLMFNIKK